MFKLKGVDREIQIGDGHHFKITEAFQQAANDATHGMILRDTYPDGGHMSGVIKNLEIMRQELRKQIRLSETDTSTRFGRARLMQLAEWLGSWDVATGRARGWGAVIPCRSTDDVSLDAEANRRAMSVNEWTRQANYAARVARRDPNSRY